MKTKASEILAKLSLKHNGNWKDIYNDISNKNTDLGETELPSDNYITLIDNEYPNRLKQVYSPAFVLYYKGQIDLINGDSDYITFSGAKNYTGINDNSIVEQCITYLAHNNKYSHTIVENLSDGLQFNAIYYALQNNMRIVVVLPCGFNTLNETEKSICDKVVEKGGLVITEFPNNVVRTQDTYATRNRIVAGLTDKLIIVKAKQQSSISVLASQLLSLGKPIYCIPHPFENNDLGNELICDGANTLVSYSQLISE